MESEFTTTKNPLLSNTHKQSRKEGGNFTEVNGKVRGKNKWIIPGNWGFADWANWIEDANMLLACEGSNQ